MNCLRQVDRLTESKFYKVYDPQNINHVPPSPDETTTASEPPNRIQFSNGSI